MSRLATSLLLVPLLLVLVLLAAACGGDGAVSGAGEGASSEPATPAAVSEPDTEPTGSGGVTDVEVTGTLGGSAIEGGCVWLDAEDGTRYELVTPAGSEVVIDPQNRVIATTEGDLIAEEGDAVTITGVTDPGLLTFCQVGEILAVQTAEAA